MPAPPDLDVIVVGAGLSGLTAATCLIDAGMHVRVLEASSEIGGRIQAFTEPTTGAYLGDLGPTWIWPEMQRIAHAWMQRLDLKTFAQYDTGEAIVERDHHSPPMRYRLPGMHDSTRIVGGPSAIISRLSGELAPTAITTDCLVTSINLSPESVEVITANPDLPTLRARHIIVAVPPRIAASTISWQPTLPAPLLNALHATPTWMAAQAKAVAVFDRPFWRNEGLSGRLASQVGPLVEAHDHSHTDGAPAALFGFIGWPHDMRHQAGGELEKRVLAQLERCFGEIAGQPLHIHIEDWSKNPHICAGLDLSQPPEHPRGVPAIVQQPLGQNQVYFAAAETASISPGLIEGAFVSGQTVAERITRAARRAGSHPSAGSDVD